MTEVILVVPRRAEETANLLNAARHLAALMGEAGISVLAMRESIEVSGLAAGVLISEADALLKAREQDRQRVAMMRTVFDRWAAETDTLGTDARWSEVEESVAGERGRRADVIVTGQPREDDGPAHQAFRALLFGTERPVLVVPARPVGAFGRRVGIAWKDDRRAAGVVVPALRWLGRAEIVHVLVGVRPGAPRPSVPQVLIEHGIRAELHFSRSAPDRSARPFWTRPKVVRRPAGDGCLRT